LGEIKRVLRAHGWRFFHAIHDPDEEIYHSNPYEPGSVLWIVDSRRRRSGIRANYIYIYAFTDGSFDMTVGNPHGDNTRGYRSLRSLLGEITMIDRDDDRF
jgi:hypothetical protein